MALFDIFKRDKHRKAEQRLQRPSKGVLKRAEKSKTEKSKPVKAVADKPASVKTTASKSDIASQTILNPLITEKTTLLSESGVYVFRISKRANKIMVKQSIKEMYGFQPKKISIINVSSKKRSSRGHAGRKSGYKKVMVYLQEGDKIEMA